MRPSRAAQARGCPGGRGAHGGDYTNGIRGRTSGSRRATCTMRLAREPRLDRASDTRMSRILPNAYIVMPAYNADALLPGVVREIPATVWEAIAGLIVVDDGSSDSTARTVKSLTSEFPKIELLRHAVNRGYGGAQKTGYGRALQLGARAVVMLHSDGQYP